MLFKKAVVIGLALFVVFTGGIVGYMIIERWPFLDSIYMTVITLASVGFMEVHPLSHDGRIFTIFLILGGTGILVYGISTFIAFIVEGELSDTLRRSKMRKHIDALSGHYIICGAGQSGKYIIDEMGKTLKKFVVIEKNLEKTKYLCDQNILHLQGDATHNATLQAVGIDRACGLVTTLQSDAENLLVVFTAKRLNPKLRVISQATEEESEQKIRMAGADSVVMPNFIGGLRMVSELIRPSVVSFLDVMLRAKEKTIRVDELSIGSTSPFMGKQLQATGLLTKKDCSVVALRKGQSESYEFNPSPDTLLNDGDTVILMGDINTINSIKGDAR